MRPAIFLRKEIPLTIVSVAPTMFGVVKSGDSPAIAMCGVDSIQVRGSFKEALIEQAKAMNSGEDDVVPRLMELVSEEASRILINVYSGASKGKAALVWPSGKVKYVDDDGIDEDTVEIDGVNIERENVFVYGYDEITNPDKREGLIQEFSQNLMELL